MSNIRVSSTPVLRSSPSSAEVTPPRTSATRSDGGAPSSPANRDRFEVASAPREGRSAPTHPVEHHPLPWQLQSQKYGQVGKSPNQTGRINGAAELAQFVFAGYNGGKFGPVSITPATLRQGSSARAVHLVGISGTERVANQSTGWITNLKAGFQQDNPALRNAREAILRSVPKGSSLVLAGHSQGGMIAQQLAADPLIKKHYQIISTVTFGSPLISFGQREGEVHRIAAAGDPTPRLSLQSTLPGLSLVAALGQQDISTDFPLSASKPKNGIAAHNNDYTDERNPELAKMDVLGRRSPRVPATLEFNPASRRFFSSPTHSAAR